MEPKELIPNSGPEQSPVNYGQSPENAPSVTSPETQIERGYEQFEQRSEAVPAAATSTPVLPPPVIASVPAEPAAASSTSDDSTPIVAADEDLIEKEWVDRAKKIIQQTKDDPYRREQEVNKLQADYLQKRYGKEIGAPQ